MRLFEIFVTTVLLCASYGRQQFPQLETLDGVVMNLTRTMCYGTCPAYSIEIHGDGTTIYNGKTFVVVEGEHRDRISKEQVRELVEAFRKANYFSLKDKYMSTVTDMPTTTTSFEAGLVKKSVVDYAGLEVGMPHAVKDLEEAIDRLAGTLKWVVGNAETVPSLKKEGWNFHSEEAQKTLERAFKKRNGDLVRDLLKEGVPNSPKKD